MATGRKSDQQQKHGSESQRRESEQRSPRRGTQSPADEQSELGEEDQEDEY